MLVRRKKENKNTVLADTAQIDRSRKIRSMAVEEEADIRQNHCWNCGTHLSADIDEACSECGWMICPQCGACDSECSSGHDERDKPTDRAAEGMASTNAVTSAKARDTAQLEAQTQARQIPPTIEEMPAAKGQPLANLRKRTRWGIPIPDGWDATDAVFQRHPMECICYRQGVLQCGVPCVWAWPPDAKPGDLADWARNSPRQDSMRERHGEFPERAAHQK